MVGPDIAATNSPSPLSAWGKSKRLLANFAIVGLLIGIVVEAIPGMDQFGGDAIRSITMRLGVWQNHWNMFAPNPDRSNHRLQFDIKYQNGKTHTWNSPEWRKLSPSEMFFKVRFIKWCDNLTQSPPARKSFTRYLAEKYRDSKAAEDRPRSVRIVVKTHFYPNPTGDRWPSRSEPYEYEDQYVLPKDKYP